MGALIAVGCLCLSVEAGRTVRVIGLGASFVLMVTVDRGRLIPKRLAPGKLTEHLGLLTTSESLPPSPEGDVLDRRLALDTTHLMTLVELTVLPPWVRTAAIRLRRVARTMEPYF